MNCWLSYTTKDQKYSLTIIYSNNDVRSKAKFGISSSWQKSSKHDTIFKCVLELTKKLEEAEKISKELDNNIWIVSKSDGSIWKIPPSKYESSSWMKADTFEIALLLNKLLS